VTVFRTLPRWFQLLLVALLARAATFGNPIVHVDEQYYWLTAHAWLHGALPYVDVWDRKPIGLFMVYLPAAALGYPLGIWGYQALALASVTASAALLARLVDRAGWGSGALAAGAAYVLWLDFLDGQGGQAPIFYNLLMVAAAALIAPRPDDAERPGRRFGWGLAALALVGLALQVKYSALFEGLYFGLWWLWREHRFGRPMAAILAGGALLVTAALLPTLAAWGAYVAIGQGPAFVYANFVSIRERVPDAWGEQAGNLALIVLTLLPLLAAAALAWRIRDGASPGRAMQEWLFGWLAAATLGLLAFGSWFNHYALPLLMPLSACAAGAIAAHRWRRFALPMLVLALLGGQAMLIGRQANRGSAREFSRVAAAVGQGPGCLYVYSGETMLYPATRRCSLSRYLFPSHLGRIRERGAIGVDQESEIRRILMAQPAVVVIRKPYRGERPEMRALVMARMAQSYRLKAQLPLGSDTVQVYDRR